MNKHGDLPGSTNGKKNTKQPKKKLPTGAGDPREVRDVGSIPGSGRSPGGGHGNPLQYSCLENPMGRGAWWAAVHGVTKNRTRLKRLSMARIRMNDMLPSVSQSTYLKESSHLKESLLYNIA